ncbi:uncharacterized protein LOC121957679 isoform X1 [Plectropomus leopardus]|uniref:uncharacterized protein LOC121957679 isoform X1 n=1 Tax=Plectropomus leopardus TaxID=160734 RepID=UPI001C4D86D1|nr:uncharacterized protein LOC121957679 isoform X1 [Plectropomus leopardus]
MSALIHSSPDFSFNVRFNRGDKKNGSEKEESQVEMCEDKDLLKQGPTDRLSHKVTVKRRPFGATAVILGVLYLLILAGIYMRYILITLEKQNVVTERDQLNMSLSRAQTSINELQTRYDNLNKSYSQLEDEKYRLEGKMAEKEELQTRYNNLRKIYRQLEDDRNHLKRMVESMESRVSYSGDLFGAFTHLSPF